MDRASWWTPLRLIWSPGAVKDLGTLAATAPLGAAVLWGGLWIVAFTAGFFLWLCVAMHEPWGSWDGVLRSAQRCIFGPLIPAGMMAAPITFIALGAALAPIRRTRAQVALLFLSLLPFTLPAFLWLACAGIVDINSDVMNDDRLDWFAENPVAAFFGSCFWAPVGYLAWGALASWGWRRVSELHPIHSHLCSGCAYDLRGSIAAGSTTCPECGHPITSPHRVPSLTPDSTEP